MVCVFTIYVFFNQYFVIYHPLKLRYLHKYIYFTGLGNPSAICIATKVRTLRYVSFNVHSNFVNLYYNQTYICIESRLKTFLPIHNDPHKQRPAKSS